MKTIYRIRKHVSDFIASPNNSKLPFTYFTVEVLIFKFWFFEYWQPITNFKPICKNSKFDSINDAKDAIAKYDTYHTQLNQDNMIVDKVELD